MKRRHFLIGAAATAANLLTPDTSRSQSDIGPHLAVSYEDPGQAIALDFIGLSYESAILAGADYFTPSNASTLGLIRALGENGVIEARDLLAPVYGRRPASASTYQVRAGHQPQDRQGAWYYCSANGARPRRRGDRIERFVAAMHRSGHGPYRHIALPHHFGR
jgi:hypothetical protein